MKKTALILMLTIIMCGCSKITAPLDVNSKIYTTFSNMQSYEASIKVTIFSNNTKNTYDTLQYYKYPDKMRSETDGMVNIINGVNAYIKNTANSQPLKIEQIAADENDFMYLQNFFAEYYKNEAAAATVSEDQQDTVVLSIETGLKNPYRTNVELVLNSSNMQPVSMEIKGKDNKVYTRIDYLSFTINSQLSDDLFQI